MLIVDEDHLELGAMLVVSYSYHLHGLVPKQKDKHKNIYGQRLKYMGGDVQRCINYLVPCLPLKDCVTP